MTTLSDVADCLVCRQIEATDAMLSAAVGSTPPDLPNNVLAGGALGCNRSLVVGMQKGIRKSQSLLDDCRADAITTPNDCTASTATALATQATKVDARVGRCKSTTGMVGCRFATTPDLTCLGIATTSIANDLAGAVFGNN